MAARTETIALAMDIRRSSRLHAVVPPVAAGLHAALLADTARQLYDLDLPDPLAEAVQEPVVGLRARATRAYEVCYELALSAGPALDGWHRFCGAGLADLAERDALDRAQSTTREPPPAPAP